MKSSTRGDVSRRTVLLRCVSALVLASTGILATYASAAQGKVSKASAKYRGHSNSGQRCGQCVHYRFALSCEIVQGPISPFGWCRFFKPK
jgi:hypothetical protein